MVRICLLLLPVLLLGAPDNRYDEGKSLYFTKGCSNCHGVSASGSNLYPSLAFRRKAFLMHRLSEFRAKKGATQQSQMMIPFAAALTDPQIDALSTFLSEYHETGGNYKSDPHSLRGDGGS